MGYLSAQSARFPAEQGKIPAVKSRGIGLVVGAVLVALVAPAAAQADSVAMFSDPGDYIGQGQQRLFRSGDSQITAHQAPGGILSIDVSGGNSGDYYTLEFA